SPEAEERQVADRHAEEELAEHRRLLDALEELAAELGGAQDDHQRQQHRHHGSAMAAVRLLAGGGAGEEGGGQENEDEDGPAHDRDGTEDCGDSAGLPFEASPPVPLSLTGEGGRMRTVLPKKAA